MRPTRQFGWEDNRFMFNRGHWKKFTNSKDGPQVGARKTVNRTMLLMMRMRRPLPPIG